MQVHAIAGAHRLDFVAYIIMFINVIAQSIRDDLSAQNADNKLNVSYIIICAVMQYWRRIRLYDVYLTS